ncbi:PEP-CTERM sorting domain-containing protein [Oceaniferula spumae]
MKKIIDNKYITSIATILIISGTYTPSQAAIVITGNTADGGSTNGQPGVIGDDSAGSLTVDSGSDYTPETNIVFGRESTGEGTGVITGPGSTLVAGTDTFGDLTIGDSGTGNLTVSDGASVSLFQSGNIWVGREAGSNGTLTVSGASQTATVNTGRLIYIGESGTGTLNVESGGVVRVQRQGGGTLEMVAGHLEGSEGTITVAEGGSINYVDPGFLDLGAAGSGTMFLAGQVGDVQQLRLGVDSTGEGELHMTGSSSLTSDFYVTVGDSGTGKLEMSGTSSLTVGTSNPLTNLYIGAQDGSDGQMTILDSASVSVLKDVHVGSEGSSVGALTLGDDGQISADGSFFVGRDDSSIGSLTLSGNAALEGTGVSIGTNGQGTLEMSGNSSITTARVHFGENNGANGEGTLSGNASIDASAAIFIGNGGTGSLTMSGGSSISADRRIFVGRDGMGTLTMESGSRATADDVFVAFGATSGTLTVTGNGTLMTVADELVFGRGGNGAGEATISLGRGGRIDNVNSGAALFIAAGSEDSAWVNFVIGDDGTGFIDSGRIDTTSFNIGSGMAEFGLHVDDDVLLRKGDKFTLIDYGNYNGVEFGNIGDDGIFVTDRYSFLINYDNDIGINDRALTALVVAAPVVAVPEPSQALLLVLGLTAAALGQRKRTV